MKAVDGILKPLVWWRQPVGGAGLHGVLAPGAARAAYAVDGDALDARPRIPVPGRSSLGRNLRQYQVVAGWLALSLLTGLESARCEGAISTSRDATEAFYFAVHLLDLRRSGIRAHGVVLRERRQTPGPK
ncbi:hypothetical protein MRX96_036499 [Rhipicephalus microplus]